jgi:hypothetical protein
MYYISNHNELVAINLWNFQILIENEKHPRDC